MSDSHLSHADRSRLGSRLIIRGRTFRWQSNFPASNPAPSPILRRSVPIPLRSVSSRRGLTMVRRCLQHCSRKSARGSRPMCRTIRRTARSSSIIRLGVEMQRANQAAFRQAASRFATGVTVLTALDERGDVCGMTANSFVTVSLSPPTVLVSVMPGRMHQAIAASGRYGVNVLPEGGRQLSRYFSGRPIDGASPDYGALDGVPRLSGCLAFFACEVSGSSMSATTPCSSPRCRTAITAITPRWCPFPAAIISVPACPSNADRPMAPVAYHRLIFNQQF